MAETILETIDFEYNVDGFSDIEDYVKSSITMSTQIKDVPEKLYDIAGTLLDFLKTNTTSNFADFAEKFNEYLNTELQELHDTIVQELQIVDGKYYNINVNHADTSDTTYKIFTNDDGTTSKNYSELLQDVDNRIDSKTTLSNTLLTDVIKSVKVQLADYADNAGTSNNTLNFNGKDYDAVVTDILTRVDNGLTIEEVQDKVENEFISYKSKDTLAFNGLSYDDFNDHIINDLKVDEAVQADKLATPDGPKDYNELYDTIYNSIIDDINTNIITSENNGLTDIIKGVKVDKAVHSDVADGANYLIYNHDDTTDHKTYTDIMNDVIDVKVNNSVEADRLTVPDSDETKTYYDIMNDAQEKIDDLQNALESGEVSVPLSTDTIDNARFLLDANDFQHSYDDILGDIDTKISDNNTAYTNDLTEGNIIPKESEHATEADHALLSDATDYIRYYDNDSEDFINASYNDVITTAANNAVQTSTELFDDNLQILFRTYSPSISDVLNDPLYTLNYETTNSDYNLKALMNESQDYIDNMISFTDIDTIIGGVYRKAFEYNDSGNISDVYFYNSNDDQIRHDTFAYDDNGNITELHNIPRIYNTDDGEQGAGTYDFDYKYLFSHNDDGTVQEIKFGGLTITKID